MRARQEWWGIDENIKAKATKLAKAGYRVLIPDLYKGKKGVDAEEASHLMENLNWDHALYDLSDAAEHLLAEGSPTVGITGFCMGGALTLGALSKSQHIVAGAAFGYLAASTPAVLIY